MALAFDLGPTEVGLLITIYGIGAALAYIPAGLAADRRTDVGGLLVATFWWVVVGHLVASVMPGYWSFVAVMALAVMGDAAWHPIGLAISSVVSKRRKFWYTCDGWNRGAEVLAPLAAGAVLTIFDWRVALQVAVVPALVMGITFALLRHRLRPVAGEIGHKTDLAGLIGPWLRLSGLRLAATMILYNMSVIGMVSMLPLYLARDVSLSPMVVAIIFAGTLLAGSLLQACRRPDRHGRSKLVISGLTLGGAAALCGAFAMLPLSGLSPFASISALVIAIAALTAIRSAFLASAVEVVDGRESATLALAFTVLDGVGALGALLAGLAGEGDGPTPLRYVVFSAWWQLSLKEANTTAGPYSTRLAIAPSLRWPQAVKPASAGVGFMVWMCCRSTGAPVDKSGSLQQTSNPYLKLMRSSPSC